MSDLPVTEYALRIREDYKHATTPTHEQLGEDRLWNCTEYPVHTQSSSTYTGSNYGYKYPLSFSERFPDIPTYDAFKTRTIDVYRKFINPSTTAIDSEKSHTYALGPREFTVDDTTSELYGVSTFDDKTHDVHTVRIKDNQLIIEKSSRFKTDQYCEGNITYESLFLSIVANDPYCDNWHHSYSKIPAISSVDHYHSSDKSVAHSYSVCTPAEINSTTVSTSGQK